MIRDRLNGTLVIVLRFSILTSYGSMIRGPLQEAVIKAPFQEHAHHLYQIGLNVASKPYALLPLDFDLRVHGRISNGVACASSKSRNSI